MIYVYRSEGLFDLEQADRKRFVSSGRFLQQHSCRHIRFYREKSSNAGKYGIKNEW